MFEFLQGVNGRDSERKTGRPFPVFIAGIHYRSVFEASIETGISGVWILKSLKSSGGFPVVIRRLMVVAEHWVNKTVRTVRKEGL
jgi:hypothetical protein